MQPAAFFPTSGLLGLLSGCVLSFLSYCDQKVKKLIFVGGGFFVLSGIFLLVGIVLYVGSISQAFDSTAGSMDSEDKYVYDYGESFYFSVLSFVLTEFSGIFAIYLYLAKHRHYLRLKREKLLAHSHSVNSCAGLVPSASRFSFEAAPERLVNSMDLSAGKRNKRQLETATSELWQDTVSASQSQWLLSNSFSKATMSTDLNPTQSREKLQHASSHQLQLQQQQQQQPPNGPMTMPVAILSKPTKVIRNITNPNLAASVTMFYEDELGETSFGYHPNPPQPQQHFSQLENLDSSRAFYDTTPNPHSSYYVDPRHQNYIISPDHSVISATLSPRHTKNLVKNLIHSPLGNLKNIQLLTSLDDEDCCLSLDTQNVHESHQCNCLQMDLTRPDNELDSASSTKYYAANNIHSTITSSNIGGNLDSTTAVAAAAAIVNNAVSPELINSCIISSSNHQLPLSTVLPSIKSQQHLSGSSRKITSV